MFTRFIMHQKNKLRNMLNLQNSILLVYKQIFNYLLLKLNKLNTLRIHKITLLKIEYKHKQLYLIIIKRILKVLFNLNPNFHRVNNKNNQKLQEINLLQIEELLLFKKLLKKMLYQIYILKILNKLVKVKLLKEVYQKKMMYQIHTFQILNL